MWPLHVSTHVRILRPITVGKEEPRQARPGRFRRTDIALRAATTLAAAALVFSPAVADTYHVDPQGRGEAATIQGAITIASSGDTILLANGTYRGPGNRDMTFEGKSITLRSISGNPDSCVIDCESQGRGFFINSGGVHDKPHIEGITVTNGHADTGGAVYCVRHCSPLFSNCIFRGNQADGDGGAIRCAEITEVVHFVNCIFVGNSAGEKGGAVALCCCSLSLFENCTVVDNEAKEGAAFSCRVPSVHLKRSIIAFHRGVAPIASGEHWYADIDSCDIFGNEGGNWVGCVDSLASKNGNVSVDPGFENVQAQDFRLRQTSPLRGAGSSGKGIGAAH